MLLTKTGKLVAIGVGAYLLYEWWKNQQPQAGPTYAPTNPSSPIPLWVQQLEADAGSGGGSSTTTTEDDTIAGLLAIPQGPGGTSQDFSGSIFGETCILGGGQ